MGSADVVALYPSLDVDKVVEIIGEMVVKSEVQLKGIDYEEVGLYIAIHKNQNELRDIGIQRLCPKRKNKQGRKPNITGQAAASQADRSITWQPGDEPENEEEKRVMIAEAIKIILRFLLKNHMYTFNDVKKKQENGGPIGLVLTDAVAKIYMTWWDRKVQEKAREEGMEIKMYKRYVDDINIIAKTSKNHEHKETNQVNEKQKSESEREKEGMEMFKRIGDSIDECIKLEVDYPSKHDDGKMPLLDVKVWLQEQDYRDKEYNRDTSINEQERVRKKEIRYEHYRKSMASKMTVHARSAIPTSQKRNILTQEVIRILKNCSQELPWQVKADHLEHLSLRLQYSGYDKKFRREVINSGIKAYRQMEENDKQGKIPLHRNREWKKNERERQKRKKKEDWFKKGDYESVIFIPATPQGKLKKKMQRKVDETDIKIKIVETTGNTLKRNLQKTSIASKKECADKECMICKTSKKKGLCRKEGVTYEIVCKGCKAKYIGETGRSAWARSKEHVNDYKRKKDSSVLWRHCKEKHDGKEQEFVFQVKDVFGEDATLRQVSEAVDIKRENAEMNSKQEWGHTGLPRLILE